MTSPADRIRAKLNQNVWVAGKHLGAGHHYYSLDRNDGVHEACFISKRERDNALGFRAALEALLPVVELCHKEKPTREPQKLKDGSHPIDAFALGALHVEWWHGNAAEQALLTAASALGAEDE